MIAETSELRRVRALPRRTWTDDDAARFARELTELLRTPEGTMQLRPVQAIALIELAQCGGVFAPIRVGGGKTLISALAAVLVGATRPLLLVPAKLVEKTRRELKELRQHWRLPDLLRVMSYELVGQPQSGAVLDTDGRVVTPDVLERYLPDLIIADECHRLKRPGAAVTKRVLRYLKRHVDCKLAAMTGTPITHSLLDCGHLIGRALGRGAPVPLSLSTLVDWAQALAEDDAELLGGREGFRDRFVSTPGVVVYDVPFAGVGLDICRLPLDPPAVVLDALEALRDRWELPDGSKLVEALELWAHARQLALGFYYSWWDHERFRNCLTETLRSPSFAIGNTERRILNVCARMTGREHALVQELGRWSTGERGDFADAMASPLSSGTPCSRSSTVSATSVAAGDLPAASASQLTTTIQQVESADYYALPVTEQSRCWATILRALPALLPILQTAVSRAGPPTEWLEARSAWGAECRRLVGANRRNLDSPKPVMDAIDKGLYPEAAPVLARWRAVRDSYEPFTVPVWLHPFAAEAAAAWLEEAGICWTEHTDFAERVAELSGAPYFHKEARDDNGIHIMDARGPVIASMHSCDEGLNLQGIWSRNLVTSIPGAKKMEQIIGRTFREGQAADVTVEWFRTCPEHDDSYAKAMNKAAFVEATTGLRQAMVR